MGTIHALYTMEEVYIILVILATLYQTALSSSIPILCVMTHCLTEFTQCSLDKQCMEILTCLSDCDQADAECSFTCGMGSEAGKNHHFVNLLKCMVENDCMDKYPESGRCLATDDQALDITDYDMVAGDWWTVWGQSCGQEDSHGVWSGAYDWYPCSHARFIQVEENEWVNNTTYCPGSNSMCNGELIVTVPQVYWSSPGVLRHDYPQAEAPVVPQIEDWKWLWISGDWAVVVWCGSNPMLEYNGAFVLSRHRSNGTIPAELEGEIKDQLRMYNMDLSTMCLTDSTECS